MTDIEQKALAQTLADHALWLRGTGGKRADLSGADLSGADLSGADLSEADLIGTDLSGTDLSGADLSGADLSGADLSGADLIGADLSGAGLSGAGLSGADLSGANLRGAGFRGAGLSGADLSGADLSGANLRGADLSGAIVRDGLTLGRRCGHASRDDGYTFYAFESSAVEPFIFAGCRAMLRSEYEAHIEKEYPNTAKAKATRACLEYVCNLRTDFGDEA